MDDDNDKGCGSGDDACGDSDLVDVSAFGVIDAADAVGDLGALGATGIAALCLDVLASLSACMRVRECRPQ